MLPGKLRFLSAINSVFLGGSSHEKGDVCRLIPSNKSIRVIGMRNLFQCHFGFKTLNQRTTNSTLEVVYILEEHFSSSMHCGIKKNLRRVCLLCT
jgi:hypothetical protein